MVEFAGGWHGPAYNSEQSRVSHLQKRSAMALAVFICMWSCVCRSINYSNFWCRRSQTHQYHCFSFGEVSMCCLQFNTLKSSQVVQMLQLERVRVCVCFSGTGWPASGVLHYYNLLDYYAFICPSTTWLKLNWAKPPAVRLPRRWVS